MKHLYVFLEDKLIGTITQNNDHLLSFMYAESWLKRKSAFAISLNLPLQEKPFGNKAVLVFFENLLPEGYWRDEIESYSAIHGSYDLLSKFGKDCAGALKILPSNKKPVSAKSSLKEISIEKLNTKAKEEGSFANAAIHTNSGFLSLAGAQDKISLVYKNKKIFLTNGNIPSTHILKPPIKRKGIKSSVMNEFYIMSLARKIGLNVPKTLLIKVPTEQNEFLYLIERYDRGKKGKRIHQEDLCQAMGFLSTEKYETHGGPTLTTIYELLKLKVHPKFKVQAINQFFKWLSFNLLIGNNDSHAKNLSFLYLDKNKIVLAPFYDLLCTEVYKNLSSKFAFNVGGKNSVSHIGKKEFILLENQLNIKSGTFISEFQATAKDILTYKNQVSNEIYKTYGEFTIIAEIDKLISKKIKAFSLTNLL